MKRLFMLILISAVIMVSCKKKDNGGGNGGTISATINGKAFYTNSVGESSISSGTQYSYGFSGTDTGGSIIILDLSAVTVGTQSFGTGLYSAGIDYYPKGGRQYSSVNSSYTAVGPGSIIVTSAGTNTVTGTFTGTFYSNSSSDSVVITNGVFTNCKY